MKSPTTAVLFDLDGTLVQTESLKAESYVRAIQELRPNAVNADDIVAAYDGLIGRSRDDVVKALSEQFGISDPQQLVKRRLEFYDLILKDTARIKSQEYPHNTALLRRVKAEGFKTALITVSHLGEVDRVIDALGVRPYLDVIVTMDDAAHPKPAPDLYFVAMKKLGVQPNECLAVEDSYPGVQSAIAAGVQCLAVANDLTRASLHAQPPLPGETIVDDSRDVDRVAASLLQRNTMIS